MALNGVPRGSPSECLGRQKWVEASRRSPLPQTIPPRPNAAAWSQSLPNVLSPSAPLELELRSTNHLLNPAYLRTTQLQRQCEVAHEAQIRSEPYNFYREKTVNAH